MISSLTRQSWHVGKRHFRWYPIRTLTTTHDTSSLLFLHIGPSGDCWTGTSLFAAKHLTPDYVKSIPLPYDEDSIRRLLDLLQDEPTLCHQMYDTLTIPDEVWTRITTSPKRSNGIEKKDE